jgi:AcrR family transcriptional regulator
MPAPAQNKRLQDSQIRRAQILAAAIEIIGVRGYQGFVLQDVARRCGLTNGGVLYHFPSKEHLLLAVLEERDRRLSGEIAAAFGPAMRRAPLDLALEVLRDIVRRMSAEPALVRLYVVLAAEALDPSHPAHDYFVARQASTLEGFATLVAPHAAEPAATAREIHALLDGLALQWLRTGQGFDLVAAWDRAIASFRWNGGIEEGETA